MKMIVLALCMADFRSSGKVCRGSKCQYGGSVSAIARTYVCSEELESLIDFVLGADALEFHKVLREDVVLTRITT